MLKNISIEETENSLMQNNATSQSIDLVKNKYSQTYQNLNQFSN